MKRSRTGSSSAVMKAESGGGEPSRSGILTIAHPVCVGESDQRKIGGFLERCNYCEKRIALYSEVFMYSNLCAFCSAECRDRQIAKDHMANKQPAKSKAVQVVHNQGIKN
ncbi:hypothetical protein DH2020_031209 [Rehmannia glutinosa]|uniref:FLZ-type domain-containing protein n=1 Tax=Rehmannia glutinosa TaxID=99300 RepID=A0ABR0VL13_REHGL